MSWQDKHLFKYGSWEAMVLAEKWCEHCKHPDGYHHLCKRKDCGCSICKQDALTAEELKKDG